MDSVIIETLAYTDIIKKVYESLIPSFPHYFCDSAIQNNDHRLKKSPNALLYIWNIWGDLIGGNSNKSPTTRIDKLPKGWVSRQPNISHNPLCIWGKWIFETIYISSIRTTATSECKLRSLPLSESESLGKVYTFTNSGMLSPELIVVPLILMAVTPVGARIRPLGWLTILSKDSSFLWKTSK